MMAGVIETAGISKRYGVLAAVDSVSLCVRKGEIYGFLGLNGAGKTTTIRMLLGMVRPSSGQAFINGERVSAGNYKLWEDVGSLVEVPYSYPELTVRENLSAVAAMRGFGGNGCVDGVMERLRLDEYADRKAGKLSLGNAQRLGIARALIHEPQILILDEPTNGLDPAGIVEVREMLKSLAADKGVTIFISSHLLDEMSKLATRIGIIHKGRLLEETDAEKLGASRRRKLVVSTRDNGKAEKALISAGFTVMHEDDALACDDTAVGLPEKAAEVLVKAGCPPYLLKVEEEDLESYFLRLTGGEAVK